MDYCAICGDLIVEDDPDASDTDIGYVHDKCLVEWIADADGRAADYYHDTAGDR